MRDGLPCTRAVRDAQRLAATVAVTTVAFAAAVTLAPASRAEAGACLRPATAAPAGVHPKRTWGSMSAVSLWIGVDRSEAPARC